MVCFIVSQSSSPMRLIGGVGEVSMLTTGAVDSEYISFFPSLHDWQSHFSAAREARAIG